MSWFLDARGNFPVAAGTFSLNSLQGHCHGYVMPDWDLFRTRTTASIIHIERSGWLEIAFFVLMTLPAVFNMINKKRSAQPTPVTTRRFGRCFSPNMIPR